MHCPSQDGYAISGDFARPPLRRRTKGTNRCRPHLTLWSLRETPDSPRTASFARRGGACGGGACGAEPAGRSLRGGACGAEPAAAEPAAAASLPRASSRPPIRTTVPCAPDCLAISNPLPLLTAGDQGDLLDWHLWPLSSHIVNIRAWVRHARRFVACR
jgi:hypothetical protein